MKRCLVALMLSAPMFALAAEPECVPATTAPVSGDAAGAPAAQAAAAQASAATPCTQDAGVAATTVLPASAPAAEPAYVPKTAHDNTPYRFDMNQNGKRMTAEEFDAWMQAKGIRVATGTPGGHRSATQGTAAANPVTPAPDTKPSPPSGEGQ